MERVSLNLAAGDWVEVLSAVEILATLDAQGCTERVPFMPEMLVFCGRRFRVFKRAHKTCDTVHWTGLRELDHVVHLALLRCHGTAHGGCQAGCLLFWHEAWLKRSTEKALATGAPHSPGEKSTAEEASLREAETEIAEGFLAEQATHQENGETRYRCQATQLPLFTRPLPWWRPRQYVRDMYYNGVGLLQVLWGLSLSTFNKLQRWRRRPTFPSVRGNLKRTPLEKLDLRPGEWVEVKSWEEIQATLDANGKNRGMTFDPEMLPYCGQRLRVLRQVETLVEEATGRLIKLPNPAVILDGSVCTAVYHRYCPRGAYPFWREIWLKRIEQPAETATPEENRSAQRMRETTNATTNSPEI